jgi:hypothetical protein
LTSAPQTLTLANTGNSALTISSIGFQGPQSIDFVQTNSCGSSLAAGANCAINVQFRPTSYGLTSNAVLAVADDATGSPQVSILTGTGLPRVTPVGNFSVSIMAEGGAETAQGWQEWFHNLQLPVTVQ